MNPTIIAITVRGLLGRRRSLLLLPLPAVLIFVAIIAAGHGQSTARDLVGVLGLATVLPLTALIVGTAVLGAEMDDGSVVHLLSKPVRRLEIIVSKWLIAAVVTALVCAVPIYIATWIVIGEWHSMVNGMLVGALAGSVIYSAVFVALSAFTRRAVVFGLLYLLLWEGFLTSALAGTRMLSVREYVERYVDATTTSPYLDAYLSLPVTIVMSMIVLALALWQGTDRLRSYRISDPT
jgi:ABC-2 type transport system permease protein